MNSITIPRAFVIFDFDITYEYCPNEDLYTAIVPQQIEIVEMVPLNFNRLTFEEQKVLLKDSVIAELEDSITFDTPDDPTFGIADVDFCFEELIP